MLIHFDEIPFFRLIVYVFINYLDIAMVISSILSH